ncbi:MAG: holo-ACP synthase [Acidiferrobacter sp.]
MIVGIGTDIVCVDRLAAGLQRFGPRYAMRILSDEERAEFSVSRHPAHFLAKRFAAKEATAKALGTGFRGVFGFGDITVTHDAYGCPRLVLTAGARMLAARRGASRWHVSLSDEAAYAVAFVVLEAD